MKTTTVWTVTDLETAPRPGRRCAAWNHRDGRSESNTHGPTSRTVYEHLCTRPHTHTHIPTMKDGTDGGGLGAQSVSLKPLHRKWQGVVVFWKKHTLSFSQGHTHTHTADAKKTILATAAHLVIGNTDNQPVSRCFTEKKVIIW